MARTVFEAAPSADVGAVILELARSEQTYTFQRPIDYATAVLAGAIAAGWRAPVFIQGDHYQFNAKKYAADPGGDDRGDPPGLPPRDRRRATATSTSTPRRWSTSRSRPSTSSSARTTRAPPSSPRSSGSLESRRRDRQRRRRDRRGRARRTPRSRSCAPTSTAIGGSSSAARPGALGICKVSVQTGTSHGGVPLPGRQRGRGQARLRGPARARRRRPRRTAWPARSSTARRRCPTSCSIASRRSRPPRSTSRPGSRTRSTSTRRSRPSSTARSRPGASRTRPTSASPTRPTSSSCTRPARRRSGRSSASCGTSRKDEILAAQRRKISFLFTELGVNGTREMVNAYIRPVEVHRPMPEVLRRPSPRADVRRARRRARRGQTSPDGGTTHDVPRRSRTTRVARAMRSRPARRRGARALELQTVYLGDRLGLYRALAEGGPAHPAELATRAGIPPRYAREWLEQQAVGRHPRCRGRRGRAGRSPIHAAGGPRRGPHRRDEPGVPGAAARGSSSAPRNDAGPARGVSHRRRRRVGGVRAGRDRGPGGEQPARCSPLVGDWIDALPDIAARLRDGTGRVADVRAGPAGRRSRSRVGFPGVSVDGIDSTRARSPGRSNTPPRRG